jgi:predicted phosphodiesterase
MKLAILSDIHGNSIALDAVLADIERAGGVDGYWLLGDFAAIGPDPVGVLEQIRALPNAHFLRGNTDRYATTQGLVEGWLEQALAHPDKLESYLEVARSMAWTMGAVTAAGFLGWMRELPLDLRMTLPDGTRVLGVHAAPGTDDGKGLSPALSEAELRAALAGCAADMVFAGHTHKPLDVSVDGIRVFNLGSVSNSPVEDQRAKYAILHADATSHRVEPRRVSYDQAAVIALTDKLAHPAAGRIAQFMRGEVRG